MSVDFHLFAGHNYYPGGGMADYQGSAKSVKGCEEMLAKLENEPDWAHVAVLWDGRLVEVAEWEVDKGDATRNLSACEDVAPLTSGPQNTSMGDDHGHD